MREIESHPLVPFLPERGRLLMLGSFPPPKVRWSMDFFYPNFQNDMWRVMGLLFFGEKRYFECEREKRFDRDRVEAFCQQEGIALYDVASRVVRLKANASDAFLEIIEETDLDEFFRQMPECRMIVATGQKAAEVIADRYGVKMPRVGESVEVAIVGRRVRFYRMPSTSRAYPLSIEKKAEAYGVLFKK